MAGSAELVGLSGPKFGVDSGETWGYIQNLEDSFEAEETVLPDECDGIVAAAYHRKRGTVTFDFIIKVPAGVPSIEQLGQNLKLTAAEFEGPLRVISKAQVNNGWQSGRGEVSIFPEFSTPATTTT